jgi:alpha-N-arabinofuranosidase
MGEFDRQRRVKLVVDEWGAWYKPGSEVNNTHLLGQQSTMRDAILAGLSLDIFHNHADKVAMANIAQLINCLQSLFLAHEDKFALTPTYHVFDMYAAHQGAQAVRTQVSAARLSYNRNGKPATMRGVGGSASVKEKQLVVTLTNADPASAKETEIGIKGAGAREVRITTLSSRDIHDHNSFASPRVVEPKAGSATIRPDGTVTITVAPASVVKLEITLA